MASPVSNPLDASKLRISPTTNPKNVPAKDDPIRAASSFCTDHMITAVWHASSGWEPPRLEPYGPLAIMPNASVLHHATECFEGMKAYRGYDSKLRLFRPDCNSRRMNMSASRVSLPSFDPYALEQLIMSLLRVDGPKFLPQTEPGTFLYIRPALIGTHEGLGPHAAEKATLFIIATYMPEMSSPPHGLRVLASAEDIIRAWPGGFGYAKVGSNYGPALGPSLDAKRQGYDQVLWLFGEERWVTECGTSNFLVVWRTREGKAQLVTAPLDDGMILDGVTRRSVLQLARERLSSDFNQTDLDAVEVAERRFNMQEIVDAVDEGRMVEAFVCGTAFFICPVSTIGIAGRDLKIPMARGSSGEYTSLIKTWLRDIMYGEEDHPWGVVVSDQ